MHGSPEFQAQARETLMTLNARPKSATALPAGQYAKTVTPLQIFRIKANFELSSIRQEYWCFSGTS